MRYIIERTSAWGERPTEKSTTQSVHLYDYRVAEFRNYKNWDKFCSINHDIMRTAEGYWRGTNNEPTEVWTEEVDDLHGYVREHGKIILTEPNNAEGLWKIEIYDDYRE